MADTIARLSIEHVRVTPATVWSFVRVAAGAVEGVGECTLQGRTADLDARFAAARAELAGLTADAARRRLAPAADRPLPDAAIASAIDQALDDLAARRDGRPAWRSFGPVLRETIPLYGNINRRTRDRTPAGFRASAAAMAVQGWRALKVAPFDGVAPATCDTPDGRTAIDAGVARVSAVRDAVGPAVAVYVDCHWRFTPAAARRAIDALEPLGVAWFECPLPELPDAAADLRALRAHANARGMVLAGLEELTSPQSFEHWLSLGAYDVVMPDVKYAGGIRALLAIGALAAKHGTACAPHNPSGPVCHAASLAACAAMPGFRVLEHQVDETPRFFAMAGDGLPRPRGGASALPAGHGFGIALDVGR